MECCVVGEEPGDIAIMVSGYDMDRYFLCDGGEELFDVVAFLDGDLGYGVFDIAEDDELFWVVGGDKGEESCGHAWCL